MYQWLASECTNGEMSQWLASEYTNGERVNVPMIECTNVTNGERVNVPMSECTNGCRVMYQWLTSGRVKWSVGII